MQNQARSYHDGKQTSNTFQSGREWCFSFIENYNQPKNNFETNIVNLIKTTRFLQKSQKTIIEIYFLYQIKSGL